MGGVVNLYCLLFLASMSSICGEWGQGGGYLEVMFPLVPSVEQRKGDTTTFLFSSGVSLGFPLPARKKTSDQTYSDSISTLSIRFH